jgi:hypothetical protein
MGKKFEIVGKDISDGYHTFDELYEHRCLLFVNLCLAHREQCAWKKDPNTKGWFLLYWDQPVNGQISYHLPEKWLPLVERAIRMDSDHAWDGHTSANVVARLEACAWDAQP